METAGTVDSYLSTEQIILLKTAMLLHMKFVLTLMVVQILYILLDHGVLKTLGQFLMQTVTYCLHSETKVVMLETVRHLVVWMQMTVTTTQMLQQMMDHVVHMMTQLTHVTIMYG